MKFERIAKTAVAGAAVLLIAACGGGGGGGGGSATTPAVKLSGTAATGLALADSAVEVKCAQGDGTATTDANGAYTLTLVGAALPCIVKVTGTAGGVTVTLHSVTEAGTADADGNTAAVANVTPLTEIIVAQLTAALPADLFAAFGSGEQITTEKLAAATTAVLAALKDATGIDLGAIDPFKTELVAATSSAPDAGNAYDKLLDELGTKVAPETLPLLVNQVASGAASGGSGGLAEAMASAAAGPLAGCPGALSGKYRTLDFFGKAQVRELNFKDMKWSTVGTSGEADIVQDASDACVFKVTGAISEIEVVMGASGVGTYRGRNTTSTNPGTPGYIFPVQSHALSVVAGEWNFVQSGFMPGDGLVHWPGKLGFGADSKVSICEYEGDVCQPDTEAALSVSARSDGGFDLNESSLSGVANVWAYRAPNGSFALFGTTNAAGLNEGTTEQSHIVASRPEKLPLPAAGAVVKASTSVLRQPGDQTTRVVLAPFTDVNTILSVNVEDSSFVRKMDDDSEETIRVNKPADGFRLRTTSTMDFHQLAMPKMGLTIGFNAAEHPTVPYVHTISIHK